MMPGAVDRRLANQSRQGRMRDYQGVCLHTMVGTLRGTDSMFRSGGTVGTESHFGVGADGTIYQWVDTAYSADANYRGSAYVISIETEDHGPAFGKWNTSGDNVPEWTPAQIRAMARIIAWAHKEHGIPIRQMKSVTERGVGYHAMGVPRNGLPSKYMGTKYQWSKYAGKVCPGRKRIAQIPAVVRLAAGGTAPAETTTEEGILGMTDRIDQTYTKRQGVKGDWSARHLRTEDKTGHYTIADGPCDFGATIKFDVVDLKPGETAYVFLAECMYKKGKPTTVSRELAIVTARENGPYSMTGLWNLYDQYKGQSPRARLVVKTRAKNMGVENVVVSGLKSKGK